MSDNDLVFHIIGGSAEYCARKAKELTEINFNNLDKIKKEWNFLLPLPRGMIWYDNEFDEWLEENIHGKYDIPQQYNVIHFDCTYGLKCICFENEEDATAFALRWL